MVPPSSFTAPIARCIARPTTTSFLVRATVATTSRPVPTDTVVVQPQKRISSPLLLHKTILPFRLLSTTTTASSTTPHPGGGSGSSSSHHQQQQPYSPPAELNEEIAFGVQDATRLYVRHGLGAHRLQQIANDGRVVNSGGGTETTTLVTRWQRMMETFLGTQVHVLSGLGYTPDEKGLGLYNQQLAQWMQKSEPDVQERLRVAGRDTWREVMSKAFDVSLDEMDDGTVNELSIVDARNVMHRVSQRMQEEDVLGEIARRCGELEAGSNPATDMAQKHVIVQEVLVHKVYLGGEPTSLVSDCGFGDGERGYVLMQCMMAEHQSDPLVAQYIGSAMMKVFEAAGLNMGALQQMAAATATSSSSTGKEEGGAK